MNPFTWLRGQLSRLLPPRDLRPSDIKPDPTDDHVPSGGLCSSGCTAGNVVKNCPVHSPVKP